MEYKYTIFIVLILIETIEIKTTERKNDLYISIDFGSYKTFYAYNFGNDINNIIFGKDKYFPSDIILYRNLSFKNFGSTSYSSFINYNRKEKDEVIFIRNLKINLFNYTNNTIIKEDIFPINYEFSLEKAIVEYLKALINKIIEEIKHIPISKNKNISKVNSNWIFTVPKIWDKETIIFFEECIQKTEIKNFITVSAPDVSSLTIFDNLIFDDKFKEIGKKFMLIDLGAHIVELTINEIIEDNRIKQLIDPFGGSFGSMNINNDLLEIIKYVIGDDIINNAKKYQEDEYIRLLADIEKIKKDCEENHQFNFEIPLRFKLTNNIFSYFYSKLISDENIKMYKNYEIKYNEKYIYIPNQLVKEIIENRINEIIEFIKSFDLEKYEIDYILLTGGFSKNRILINSMRKIIINIPIYFLFNPENTILEGAFIYYFNKNKLIQKNIGKITKKNKKKFEIDERIKSKEIKNRKTFIINSIFFLSISFKIKNIIKI